MALIYISVALRQTLQLMLQDHGYGDSASRGVPVYVSAFTGTKLLLGDRGTMAHGCEQLAQAVTQ